MLSFKALWQKSRNVLFSKSWSSLYLSITFEEIFDVILLYLTPDVIVMLIRDSEIFHKIILTFEIHRFGLKTLFSLLTI